MPFLFVLLLDFAESIFPIKHLLVELLDLLVALCNYLMIFSLNFGARALDH